MTLRIRIGKDLNQFQQRRKRGKNYFSEMSHNFSKGKEQSKVSLRESKMVLSDSFVLLLQDM